MGNRDDSTAGAASQILSDPAVSRREGLRSPLRDTNTTIDVSMLDDGDWVSGVISQQWLIAECLLADTRGAPYGVDSRVD